MIHHIKSLYAEGSGMSIRAIAEELGISRNTVRKYLRMKEAEISRQQEERSRTKLLDVHREYIEHLLQLYPRMNAVKVLRKLRARHGDLEVSDRTVRRYIERLRESVTSKQERYYEPVLDMIPGVQCQVDPGELRGVIVDGVEVTVYFVVFVLSYSRLMYVSVSDRPINTEQFIRMHDAALRYFGGRPEEIVYDQTKLVVLREQFRELKVNQRFHEYATHAGFTVRVCKGFDPESKGKVEAGVKYVKNNGLYGEAFADWSALETYVSDWLDTTANVRVHATTGRRPREMYEAHEQSHMAPYLTPVAVHPGKQEMVSRKSDKTGLISWQSNKYSVPMRYQRSQVGVRIEDGSLRIFDLKSDEEVASHPLCAEKGKVIRNTHHYRDRAQQVADFEAMVLETIGEELGIKLCALLKVTSPKIYKDQLAGATQVLTQYQSLSPPLLHQVLQRPRLTVTGLRDYLEAYACRPERLRAAPPDDRAPEDKPSSLGRYAGLADQETETPHELH